jgi:putative transposase
MRKTFEYRLYPNNRQQRLLDQQLEECRWLYNHLLAARRDAWEQRQESLRLYDQQATLPALKAARPALAGVQSQVLQNVAVRMDLAFQAFFRRVRTSEAPGYPRFRGRGRYASITYPQVPVGCKVDRDPQRLRLHGVGEVKLLLHRPLDGTPKTATSSRSSTGKWSVCFSSECAEPAPLPGTGQRVGSAVGLTTFATLSDGQETVNPRFFQREERALAKAHRRRSNEEKGTPERAKRRKVVARVPERIAWRRSDFTHQHSRRIVNQCDLLAVEDLSVNRMTHNHCLAKSIHDAAWGQFASLLSYKAAWAGRRYIAVDPAYTSQNCSGCGHRKADLTLADRTYPCAHCGLVIDRDRTAAGNILAQGKALVALGRQCLGSP